MPVRCAHPRTLPLLTAAAALCAPLLVPPLAAQAQAAPRDEGGSWSAAPSTGHEGAPGDGARRQLYLEGEPGTVLTDAVSLTNTGRQERTYTLRGAGTRHGDTGGRWITPAERTVHVPARTRADIPLTVTVPPDALPGAHPGRVVVSDGKRDAEVPVQIRVTGPELAALSVEDAEVRTAGDGSTEVAYELVNRGNTALEPQTALLFGGSRTGPREQPDLLLPGERVTLREPWPDAPVLAAAAVTVRVTADGGARGEDSAVYRPVPWPAVLGLGALLAAGTGGGRYRLRRRPFAAEPTTGEPACEENGQTDEQYELTATGAAK